MADTDFTPLAEGDTAENDIYVVYGIYEDVEDLDGSTVTIERAYPSEVFATELKPGERGGLLVAAGTEVTAEVAARLAQ